MRSIFSFLWSIFSSLWTLDFSLLLVNNLEIVCRLSLCQFKKLNISFAVRKLLSFLSSNFSIFTFVTCASGVLWKSLWLAQCLEGFILFLLIVSWVGILHLGLWSLLNWFLWMVRGRIKKHQGIWAQCQARVRHLIRCQEHGDKYFCQFWTVSEVWLRSWTNWFFGLILWVLPQAGS